MSETPPVFDPFAALGLPRRFDLDEAAVTRAWLQRSMVAHPDRANGSENAGEKMAIANLAREVLRDPERRANALLQALGGPSREQDRSLPAGFLQQTLEMREAIEESLASGDASERERIEQWAHEQRAQYVQRVGAMFAALGDAPGAADLADIRRELNAWRYIERLIEQLDPAYDPRHADFRS